MCPVLGTSFNLPQRVFARGEMKSILIGLAPQVGSSEWNDASVTSESCERRGRCRRRQLSQCRTKQQNPRGLERYGNKKLFVFNWFLCLIGSNVSVMDTDAPFAEDLRTHLSCTCDWEVSAPALWLDVPSEVFAARISTRTSMNHRQ